MKNYGYSWATYKSIENDLLRINEYIPFETKQYDVYSFKLSDIIIRTCSQIDSFFKDYIRNEDLSEYSNQSKISECNQILNGNKINGKNKIYFFDYMEIFTEYIQLKNIEIKLLKNNDLLYPFHDLNISQKKPPGWWTAYNNLKHDFYKMIQKATLKKALESLSALFALNILRPGNYQYLFDSNILHISLPFSGQLVPVNNQKHRAIAKTELFEFKLKKFHKGLDFF